MKGAPSNYILALLIIGISLSIPVSTRSQQLISHFEIERGAFNDCQEYMIHDHFENYYVGLETSTESPNLVIGDTSVNSYRIDPISNTGLSDFYFLRFDTDHKLTGSFVIDNADYVRDFYSTGDHSFISMYIFNEGENDSLYPITLGGDVVLEREGNLEKGILIVLDDSMKLVKTLLPTTGEIVQVAADGDYAYLDIRIPDMVPYILIDQDTVHNQLFQIPGLGYGLETIVLCKYDYVHEKAVWWLRIGNVGSEQLFDMELDPDKNLLILGITSSSKFSFDGVNEVDNFVPDKPFIGKYSPEGVNLWGILNSDQPGEGATNIEIDKVGNIYLLGYYWQTQYTIGDTTIYNPHDAMEFPNKSFVSKFNSSGVFEWISQLDGNFEYSELNDIAFINQDKVVASGYFVNGDLKFGNEIFHDVSGSKVAFLWELDSHSGSYSGHTVVQGKLGRAFQNLYVDNLGILNAYLLFAGEESIFGEPFSSFMGYLSGYMLKLTTDFTSSNFDVQPPKESSKLYPNPVSQGNFIKIDLLEEFSNTNYQFKIYDITGKLMISDHCISNDQTVYISTKELSPGLYFVQLQNQNGIKCKSFIVD